MMCAAWMDGLANTLLLRCVLCWDPLCAALCPAAFFSMWCGAALCICCAGHNGAEGDEPGEPLQRPPTFPPTCMHTRNSALNSGSDALRRVHDA